MKLNKFLLALLLSGNAYVMNSDESTIHGASYFVIEGASDNCINTFPIDSETATFYTFDGEELSTLQHNRSRKQMSRLLDPSAPNPQPVRAKIKWWPAIDLGGGLTKGVPGYFIMFFDKNSNKISSSRYKYSVEDISLGPYEESLDLRLIEIDAIEIDTSEKIEKFVKKKTKMRIF